MGSRGMAWALLCLALLGGQAWGAEDKSECAAESSLPHISHINLVLPPPTETTVRFLVHGFHGCFTWRATDDSVIKVEEVIEEGTDCSTAAYVWAASDVTERMSSFLIARETGTGMELQCEVRIDRIARLAVVHDTLKLHLGHMEALYIQGFDADGNIFSSLEGLRFSWELLPLRQASLERPGKQVAPAVPPIKHVPLDRAHKKVSSVRMAVECDGLYSDVMVVNGTAVGRSQVTATLQDAAAGEMSGLSSAVNMTVVELLFIEPSPSPLYILPMSTLQLSLFTVRGGKRVHISMPTLHYRWTARNTSLLSVDMETGLVRAGGREGQTTVHVDDIRVPGTVGGSVTIIVAPPAVLELSVSPEEYSVPEAADLAALSLRARPAAEAPVVVMEGGWPLVVSRGYFLGVVARTKGGQRIILTNESAISTSEGTPGVYDVTRQGTPGGAAAGGAGRMHSLVRAAGEAAVGATVEWHMDDGQGGLLHQWISANQDVAGCHPAAAPLPDLRAGAAPGGHDVELRLPHAAKLSQGYDLMAVVTGACPDPSAPAGQPVFRFGASPAALAGAGTTGLVVPSSAGLGAVLLSAFWDIYLGHNRLRLPLRTSLPAAAVKGSAKAIEVEVGELVELEFVLLDSAGNRYHNCTAVAARTEWFSSAEAAFAIVESLRPPGAAAAARGVCAVATARAVAEGAATITATWPRPGGAAPVSATWHLGAFPALRVHFHGCQGAACNGKNLLMAPGSVVVAGLRGGPAADRRGGKDPIDSLAIACRAGAACDTAALQVEPLEKCRWPECAGVDPSAAPALRHFALRCAAEGRFVVNVTLAEKSSAPTVAFDVACEPPAAVLLVVAKELPDDAALEAAVASEGSRPLPPIPVLHHRFLRATAVAVDAAGAPYVGTSSLAYTWRLAPAMAKGASDADKEAALLAMPKVKLFAEGRKGDDACDSGRCYGRDRWLWLPEEVGSVVVHVEAPGAAEMSDEAELLLVGPVRLDPPGVLLFRDSGIAAELAVLGGTRQIVSRLNDTALVDMKLEKPTSWSEDPKAPAGEARSAAARVGGGAVIRVAPAGSKVGDTGVEATCVPTGSRGRGAVVVEDLHEVRVLLEGGSVQLGQNMTLGLRVLDRRGRTFHPSQIPAMDPQIHLHDARLRDAGGLMVVGAAAGLAPLHVSVRAWNGTRVRSLVARVTVYEPLVVRPESIVLAPGGSYTVLALGGAGPGTGVAVKFHSDDPKVATVDPYTGCVSAKGPGSTKVWASAQGTGGEDLGAAFALVDVPTLGGVRINVGGRLGVGREVAATIHGLGAREDIHAIGQVCWGYHWSVSNMEIARLERGPASFAPAAGNASADRRPPAAIAGTQAAIGCTAEGVCGGLVVDTGFSARLFGKQPGVVVVSVSVTCATANTLDPTSLPVRFTASETVRVEAPHSLEVCACAMWLLPPLYTTGRLLPHAASAELAELPGGSEGGRRANYTVLQAAAPAPPVLSLDGQGRITTHDGPDIACIRSVSGGEARIAACVRVTPIAQLVLGGHTHNPPHAAELSMGATAVFAVTLQDEAGHLFGDPPVQVDLEVDNDHPQVVMAELSSGGGGAEGGGGVAALSVSALQQGTAIVRVRLRGDPRIAGFVAVQVGDYVQPRSPRVLAGATIQFSTGSLGGAAPPSDGGKAAHATGPWASSNESVLRVDSSTGLAVAVAAGTATVHYNSTQLTTYTPVTVVHVGAVLVSPPAGVEQLTNVAAPGASAPGPTGTYRFPVAFTDTNGFPVADSAAGAVDQRVGFECRVEPASAGRVLAKSSPVTGEAACELVLRAPSAAAPPSGPVTVIAALSAPAGAGAGDEAGEASASASAELEGRATLPFVGGFELQPGTPEAIVLHGKVNSSTLAVIGNTAAVAVTWTQRDRVNVDPVRVAGGPQGVYRVSVVAGGASFTDSVVLSMAATGQRVEIPVRYEAPTIAAGAVVTSALKNAAVLLAGAACALVFLLCFRPGDERRGPRAHTPRVGGGGTPAAAGAGGGSPYTPAPGGGAEGGFQDGKFVHSPSSGFRNIRGGAEAGMGAAPYSTGGGFQRYGRGYADTNGTPY